ncbi:MAG: 5'/3'-nucleotidase SurE [Treponema sp.]|nr:5'/3'-nucleotidase SurE [Treponema sp.]
MRILLTNDDGIHSPGLLLLADALRKAGHRVFVFAPAADKSGVSHAITFFNGPCKLVAVGEDTWSCEGTPVDCVIIALLGGIPALCLLDDAGNRKDIAPIDCIISGINRGANLGTDIVYSGTAAAARQGALCGIPSLALSLLERDCVWRWDMAVAFVLEYLDQMLAYWKPHSFINVNMPNMQEKPAGLVHAFPSLRYYNDRIEVYQAPDGHQYCFANAGKIGAQPDQGSDCMVAENNHASISEIYIHPLLLGSVRGEA